MRLFLTSPARTVALAAGRAFPPETRTGRWLRSIFHRLTPEVQRPRFPRVLQGFADSREDVAFLQIGSNDGGWGDPLRPYIIPRRWRGIVVEPQPEVFARLQKRYAGHPDVAAECVAIAPEDGMRTLYYLQPSEEPGLPPWYDQLASFSRNHLVKHRKDLPDIETRIRSREVPCLSVESLLHKHGLKRIDLLHVDAEGYDYEILRTARLEWLCPAIVLFEHRHLAPGDEQDCRNMFRNLGYEQFRDRFDTLCVHREALQDGTSPIAQAWRALTGTATTKENA